MSISTLDSVGEYLRTSYSPDCDYVDGEVRERNPGNRRHSHTQGRSWGWFDTRKVELGLEP